MATLADSLVSSSSRPLPIRVRADLTAQRVRYQGRVYYVVKDPVGLNYFRFEEEEYAILYMLDGKTSLDAIRERFEEEFPPQTIRVEELQQFIGMLHKSGLVITGAPGQGLQLRKRRDEKRKKELLGTLTNILAIRFKGFDPDRLMNRMYPYVRWFFSKPVTIFNVLFAASAALLVIVQFDVFRAKLPSFESFFAAQNWLWLAVVLAGTKILHEFGHGLSCKHFGGECHEIGIMLLVLTPCLYCNVSDSWMLPNRWHRAAIGAAGMYVEIVIASICTYIWWFTEPGPLHFTCLNIMFISSVSTILFNANPLLRYDGYYILSDIMEVPNLRQKATTILSRKMGKWCLGLEEPEDPFLPKRHQWLFALYTIAAVIYRWFILIVILIFLNKVFEPYGLKVIGQLIALMSIAGLIIQPLWKLYKFFSVPGRLSKVKKKNVYATLVVVGAAVAGLLMIPFPSAVYCDLEIMPRDAEAVHVEVPGLIEEVGVEPGQWVEKDVVLARLSNIDIELEILPLVGEKSRLEAQLVSLKQKAILDGPGKREQAASQIPVLEEQKNTLEARIAEKEDDRRKLTLTSTRAGRIIPPPLSRGDGATAEDLPSWSGTPLDKENRGALLVPGERGLLCWVGDPDALEASLVIDQADIEFVRPNQEVEIILEQDADRFIVMTGRIAEIAPEEMKATSPRLAGQAGGDVATQVDERGMARPLSTSYAASVPIDASKHGALRVGLTGRAKIHTAPRTLGSRLWRYISRTFSFEL
jgi:putative peptide zinc metalloprotease protein